MYFQREYRRYYPQSNVTAHILGFTNIDDEGQEGLELAWKICGFIQTESTGVLIASGSPLRSTIIPRCAEIATVLIMRALL